MACNSFGRLKEFRRKAMQIIGKIIIPKLGIFKIGELIIWENNDWKFVFEITFKININETEIVKWKKKIIDENQIKWRSNN